MKRGRRPSYAGAFGFGFAEAESGGFGFAEAESRSEVIRRAGDSEFVR